MLQFIVNIALVTLSGLLQSTSLFWGFGIKPNLVIPTLAVIANIEKSWRKRIVLILVSLLSVKFAPRLDLGDLLFVITAFLTTILVDRLPWQKLINTLVASFAGVLIIDALSLNLKTIFSSSVVSVFITMLLYLIYEIVYAKKHSYKKDRF